jgi:hypothetical protein
MQIVGSQCHAGYMYDIDGRQNALAPIENGLFQALAVLVSATWSGQEARPKIELVPWQRAITSEHPAVASVGCFISDGCRFINRVRRPLSDGDRWYEYPRSMFTNESKGILALCGAALDDLGVSWRYSRRTTISVARREAVARLDEFVGPKYCAARLACPAIARRRPAGRPPATAPRPPCRAAPGRGWRPVP